MKPMSRLHLFAALAGSFSLVACGGGGGSDVVPAAAAVAGVYVGSGGSSRASAFAILDDGRYYLVYGRASSSVTPAGGVVIGTGSVSGGMFTSSDAHDFDLQSQVLRTGTLNSAITAKASASTTVVPTGGSAATYAGTFDPASDAPATLSAVAATYVGELADLGGTLASLLTIDASGGLAGTTSSGACSYAGFVSPHGSGNVYDVTINFRTGCPNPGNTLHGHGFLIGKLLHIVVASGDLSSVELFAGVRP